MFDHKTADLRRSKSSHSSCLAIHTSLLAFHHPYGQPPVTTIDATDVPLTAHVDVITNAEVPNATVLATVTFPLRKRMSLQHQLLRHLRPRLKMQPRLNRNTFSSP